MGLFADLLNSKRQKEKAALKASQERWERREAGLPRPVEAASKARHSLSPWKTKTPLEPVDFSGDCRKAVFIYDASPLADLPIGSSFEVEFLPGSASMKSVYTGTRCSSDDYDCCVLYEGEPIGFVSFPLDVVRTAFKRGLGIKVRAEFEDWYEAGVIPGVYVYTQESAALRKWQLIQKAVSLRVPLDLEVVNLYIEEDTVLGAAEAPCQIKGAGLFLEQPASGSKAKPHFEVRTKDGELVTKVTARSSRYAVLSSFGDRQPDAFVSRLGDDGLTILYLAYWEPSE